MQHLKYHDRVAIEFEVSENPDPTLKSVAEKLGVSRSTVMREIIRNSIVTKAYSPASLPGTPKQAPECPKLRKWPYCCNRCAKTKCHLAILLRPPVRRAHGAQMDRLQGRQAPYPPRCV